MKGIDIPIEKALSTFNTALFSSTTKKKFYGRCVINDRSGNDIPEVLMSGSKNYKEVLLNDKLYAMCFFDVDTTRQIDSANVDIYFALNLKKLYPTVTERATEYAIADIKNVINYTAFEIEQIVTDKDAYAKFNHTYVDNMQPFFLLKFETKVTYNLC